jgi:lysophospholipase L1-like esterase
MEGDRKRRRRFVGAVIRTAVGVLLAVAVLEAALRWVPIPAVEIHRRGPVRHLDQQRFFLYDPELGWRGRPQAEGPFSGWEFTTRVHLNAEGFRDRAVVEEKPAAHRRILLFGDSIMWGYGVEEGERFSDLLPGLLASRGVEVEVLNLAVNGYDTGQELLLYRRIGMRSCADLVIVGLYENDLRESVSAWQGPYAKPYFRLVEGRLELANVPVPQADWASLQEDQRSGLKRWLREHVRVYALAAWARETLRSVLAPPPSVPTADEPGMLVTARLLRQFQQEVTEAGGRFAVVLLPDHRVLEQGDGGALRRVAAAAGIEATLDLAPRFRDIPLEQRRRLFYRLDGAHWTPEGHALAARHLAAFIQEAKLLEGPVPCRSA